MIFLYTLALLLVAALKVVIARRAVSLERKYSKVAGAVLKQANEPYKLGNSGKTDVGASAKRVLELGLLVSKRDALERKCIAWRSRADKLDRVVTLLRAWKGKKLPYTMGALDVWLVLYFIDRFGAPDAFSPRHVMDSVLAWLGW
jgi:hypothetical protein